MANRLLNGSNTNKNINIKDIASSNRCTMAGAVKKSKMGAAGTSLSMVHNFQPIIFVSIQQSEVACKKYAAIILSLSNAVGEERVVPAHSFLFFFTENTIFTCLLITGF